MLKMFVVLLLVAAGCSGADEGQVSAEAETSVTPTTDLESNEVVVGDHKITGRATGLSDVQTQPSGPLVDVQVLIVANENFQELWDVFGFEAVGESSDLRYFSVAIPDGALPSALLVPISDGGFMTELASGEYRACLTDGQGLAILGCGGGSLSIEGPSRWGISSGEGGVEVSSFLNE